MIPAMVAAHLLFCQMVVPTISASEVYLTGVWIEADQTKHFADIMRNVGVTVTCPELQR